MIRLLIKRVDLSRVRYGGEAKIECFTFDFELPEAEEALRGDKNSYSELIGWELRKSPHKEEESNVIDSQGDQLRRGS